MNGLQRLHKSGQSIWLDFIRRELLRSGTLKRYIEELAVTGLTSNPSIFQKAITETSDYDEELAKHTGAGADAEKVFFDIALQDICAAAEHFRAIHENTQGRDGFVSLEVSPALADDAKGTLASATALHSRANLPNVFIKIPGTKAGLSAIEESIAAGIPVNVTLLFDTDQYLAAAEAYTKGIERRVAEGLDPNVQSVASLFISRWDVATESKLPVELANKLGIAVGAKSYAAYQEFVSSKRWDGLRAKGAQHQRLLFASTGTKKPELPDTLYVAGLAADDTVNTMPEKTLLAFGDHGDVKELLPRDGADADKTLAAVSATGVDLAALAQELQDKGRDAFVKDFDTLIACVSSKIEKLKGG